MNQSAVSPRSRHGAALRLRLLALATLLLVLGTPLLAVAQNGDNPPFPTLTHTQRVYDETGTSLTAQQTADLQQRADTLAAQGLDLVIDVRNLNVDPDTTLKQVEALKNQWVSQTGSPPDTSGALLINRNPDDANDARVGLWVGKTFDRGNLPEGERTAINDDEIIPHLRDGDVYGGLVAGLERISHSVQYGPHRNAFEKFADKTTGLWMLPVGAVVAAAGALGGVSLLRRQPRTSAQPPAATTTRPGDLPPALAGALVAGSPQSSAFPATLLDLADRGALAIEPEGEGGVLSKPTVQVRLLDERQARNPIDKTVWELLRGSAEGDVVSGKALKKLVGKTAPVKDELNAIMARRGWKRSVRTERSQLGIGAAALAVLGVGALVVAGNAADSGLWPIVGGVLLLAGAAGLVAIMALLPTRSVTGQEAALPWNAYRDGIKAAGKDEAMALDLNAVLPDAVAMNLGGALDKRLKAAGSSGQALRAFGGQTSQSGTAAFFPYWVAFSSTTTASSGGGAGASVSSSGGASGGGSAGST